MRAQSEAEEKGETRQGEKEAEHLTVRGGAERGRRNIERDLETDQRKISTRHTERGYTIRRDGAALIIHGHHRTHAAITAVK